MILLFLVINSIQISGSRLRAHFDDTKMKIWIRSIIFCLCSFLSSGATFF